ncbi:hypothetical protein [Vibrio palustris]|uniref:Uncharacterized protein n=1 Tax=Vibrio palustris TaxID=1918946 RepID=A0A1R4B2H7_9VIBR|nr:hypothetical protein [Vibrio palustris]SJL83115.1 hypothetical protein VPAL9027_01064 [Vibrio palustris]
MAAEKLTKQRLMQIVIMMLLLIGAFTWRSWTYDEQKTLSCKGHEQCRIQVDSQMIEVFKTSMSSYEINQVPKGWMLTSQQGEFTQIAPQKWSMNINPNQLAQPIYVVLNDTTRMQISI